MFGKDVIKAIAVSKEKEDFKEKDDFRDKQTLVQVDSSEGILIDPDILLSPGLISAVPSLIITTPQAPENLKPDATVISDVYKKIENVEEEQNEINETIEQRKRRKTSERKTPEEMEENKEYDADGENAED
jgi:hypothetical protein